MTAETAIVLPILIAITMALVWLISLGVAQVRVVDAARETARAAARDEATGAAIELGARVAPPGARFSVVDEGETVRVRVTAQVAGPGGLFGFLPGAQVDSTATAAHEAR